MPRYRFTAVDSYGTAHDGTIDAPTEDAARNKLMSNGLSVRTVEEAAAAPGVEPPDVPRRAAPKPSVAPDGSSPPVRRPRGLDPADAPVGRRGSPWPLALSALALLVSVATAAYTFTRRDPLSNRLGKYDFSTAEAAFLSEAKMQSSGDILAQMEYHQKTMSSQFREKGETLRVDRSKTADYHGKTVLFYEFEQDGSPFRDVVSMERDDRGVWRRAFIPFQEIQDNDPSLFRKIAGWKTGGVPGMWGKAPGPGDGP